MNELSRRRSERACGWRIGAHRWAAAGPAWGACPPVGWQGLRPAHGESAHRAPRAAAAVVRSTTRDCVKRDTDGCSRTCCRPMGARTTVMRPSR